MSPIVRANFDHSDIGALFDRVGERQGSCGDRSKDPRRFGRVENFVHHVAENGRPDFHRPDFINDNKLPCTHGRAERFDANSLQRGKIESILPHTLRRFEIHMREYSLFSVECDDLESNTPAGLADFLSIKAAGRNGHFLHNPLNERRLPASGWTCQQNFRHHLTRFASGNARKTKLFVRQSKLISIRGRTVGICRLCRDAAAAMIWA